MGEKAELPVRPNRRRRRPASDLTDPPSQSLPKRARESKPDLRCDLCKLMFSQQGLEYLNSPDGFLHWTRNGFMTSRTTGCRMCEFIYLAAYNELKENWRADHRLVFRNFRGTHSMRTISGIQLPGIYGLSGSLESDPDKHIIRIYPFTEKDNPLAAIVFRRPLHRDVQSDAVFRAAKSLIKECMHPSNPHRHCQYSRDTVLPTRVLDVGEPNDPSPTIRLKVNESETHAPYLALSYCWGEQPRPTAAVQPLLLHRHTLRDLTGAISLESLQQTIQDAIYVTRELGFRYLWVDALCIIQDCEVDKGKQISRMAAIYKNAAIVIAAASARKAADGFLSKTVPPYLPGDAFNIPMLNKQTGTVYLSAEAYQPVHPLDERGWALQEFMLSSRMLLFSDYELLWQCKEMDLRGVTGMGLEYLQPLQDLPWIVFDEDEEPFFGNDESERVYLWRTIVQQYTKRRLTDPEDRLRAIAGIMTELETLWRDAHLHGLWKNWFIELLAWYKPSGDRERRRHLKRAPSWSWASLDGMICHEPLKTKEAKIKVLTVSTVMLTCRVLEGNISDEKIDTILEQPDLKDPMGELRQGSLRQKEAGYLLLGTVNVEGNIQKGIGLLVVDVGKRVYRRIGLVIFTDMAIWKGVKPREITLEPRLGK